jgi:hypothetical protein
MTRHSPFNPRKMLVEKLRSLAQKHSLFQVFSDANEMNALAISNKFDLRHFDEREARYMAMIKPYLSKNPTIKDLGDGKTMPFHEDLDMMCQIAGATRLAIEHDGEDLLGSVFHELELHNAWRGQYFSPYPLSKMMAAMVLTKESVAQHIKERGYFSIMEPACGPPAGCILAAAEIVRELGYDLQQTHARHPGRYRFPVRAYGLPAVCGRRHPGDHLPRRLAADGVR